MSEGHAQYPNSEFSAPGSQSYAQAYRPGPPARPPSNGGWAAASLLLFWPLAFVALSRAFEVYPLWAQGRQAEAEAASASVRRLGIISLAVFGILIGLYVVAIVLIIAFSSSDASDVDTYGLRLQR